MSIICKLIAENLMVKSEKKMISGGGTGGAFNTQGKSSSSTANDL
jgi:hypothetical protein